MQECAFFGIPCTKNVSTYPQKNKNNNNNNNTCVMTCMVGFSYHPIHSLDLPPQHILWCRNTVQLRLYLLVEARGNTFLK